MRSTRTALAFPLIVLVLLVRDKPSLFARSFQSLTFHHARSSRWFSGRTTAITQLSPYQHLMRQMEALYMRRRPCWQLGSTASSSSDNIKTRNKQWRFVVLGGTGQIGTAVAAHLLLRVPTQHYAAEIVLVGRDAAKGARAVKSLCRQAECSAVSNSKISFVQIPDIHNANDDRLEQLLRNGKVDCLIHTAGPFEEHQTWPFDLALQCCIPVYIDVADPLSYLDRCLLKNQTAVASGTTALLSAGAFPGMSNVLAIQAAAAVTEQESCGAVQDLYFQYFTAGLGGSGAINLYITNVGFGQPMVQYDRGELKQWMNLSGRLLGLVDFFGGFGSREEGAGYNKEIFQKLRQRGLGLQPVFSWPFPEAATVAKELRIRGTSLAAMGTAPNIWNTMLGMLGNVIPRPWWRNQWFCQFLANFSQPLVVLSDFYLSCTGMGETHAMRVDVTTTNAGSGVSILQAHESFRTCVGQSCAEFAIDCLEQPQPGVYLPEQRYRDVEANNRIVQRLTTTPGTLCYTGPLAVDCIMGPTNLLSVLAEANQAEQAPL